MKKLFFLCFFLIIGAVAVQAQEKKTSFYETDEGEIIETAKPIFKFNEESFNFGELKEGDPYTHEFLFTNIGNEPLIITDVKASCGCTTPDWTKEAIPAGGTGIIKATYNTKGRPGKFTKAITVTSNAITPTKRLFIEGDVITEPTAPAEQAPVVPVVEPEHK